jgi:hypothetical protein
MKFQLTMAKQIRGLGGGGRGPTGTTAATPTNNIRGNNNNDNFVLLPSGGLLPNNTAAQDDLLLTPTDDLLLLQPENLWLDLASDMSTFIELDSIPEVIPEDKTVTAGGGSLLLPDLVRGLGLKEDDPEEMELMQAANMKILDEYRCFMQGNDISFDDDGIADDSMDSFASDLDSNQSLIEEVETYLQGVSGIATATILMPEEAKAVVEEAETKAVIPAVVSRQETVIRKLQQQQSSKLTAEDNSRILKAMVEGKVLAPPADNSFEDSFTSGSSCDGSFELTEEDLVNAYTTTIKTENGQDVIIIIAQPGSPASRYVPDMVAASPSLGSPTYSCSDDYEWSPSPQQQQRKKYQRKNRPTPLAEPYPRYICFYYHCCGALILIQTPDTKPRRRP